MHLSDFTILEDADGEELGARATGPGRVELAQFIDGAKDAAVSIEITTATLVELTDLVGGIPADSPAGLLRTAYQSPGDHTSEPDALAALTALRAKLADQEAQLVFAMRLHGATWQQIADATGMESSHDAQLHYERSAGLLDRLAEARGRSVPE